MDLTKDQFLITLEKTFVRYLEIIFRHQFEVTLSQTSEYNWKLWVKTSQQLSSTSQLFLHLEFYTKGINQREKQTKYMIDSPLVRIIDFEVKPERCGYGTQIINLLKTFTRELNFQRIILFAYQPSSIGFFLKNNFSRSDDSMVNNDCFHFDL
jgi:hypothetical protein